MSSRILVLGAAGMLGNAAFRYFTGSGRYDVWGTLRNTDGRLAFPSESRAHLLTDIDVTRTEELDLLIRRLKPAVVLNCVGVVKQLESAHDPLAAIPLNSLLPHQLSRICADAGARFIHISTDCVFSGAKGQYLESDVPDARDLYGLSKLLGEVVCEGSITLRTSIIGHEISRDSGLLGWFLAQQGTVKGFRQAYFSGLTTTELAKVIDQYVIPDVSLSGLYHVSAERISKYDLLCLIAQVYEKEITIDADEVLVIDRSLNSDRFKSATGYLPPGWPQMIAEMAAEQISWGHNQSAG